MRIKQAMVQFATFIFIASIPVLPWLIKNWVFTGNPVYPIANDIFHSPYWSPEQTELFHRVHSPTFDSVADWVGLIKLAWFNSTVGSQASPILLMMAPLFLLIRRPPMAWKYYVWLSLLMYLCWWGFTFRPWRFLFPALPWFALVGSLAVVTLIHHRPIRLCIQGAMAVLLLFQINCNFIKCAAVVDSRLVPIQTGDLALFLGHGSRFDYLGRRMFTHGWLNSELPPNAKVLYVGEARVYYAGYPVLFNTAFDKSIIGEMVARSKTPDDLLREMLQAGVTHLYLHQGEVDRLMNGYGYLKDMNWTLFREFLAAHTRKIYENGVHSVYALKNSA